MKTKWTWFTAIDTDDTKTDIVAELERIERAGWRVVSIVKVGEMPRSAGKYSYRIFCRRPWWRAPWL
jgi:hypothetical protein